MLIFIFMLVLVEYIHYIDSVYSDNFKHWKYVTDKMNCFPFRALWLTVKFMVVRISLLFLCSVLLCRPLNSIFPFSLAIASFVLIWLAVSDYPFCIFKPSFSEWSVHFLFFLSYFGYYYSLLFRKEILWYLNLISTFSLNQIVEHVLMVFVISNQML
jgi:hypothetical protein